MVKRYDPDDPTSGPYLLRWEFGYICMLELWGPPAVVTEKLNELENPRAPLESSRASAALALIGRKRNGASRPSGALLVADADSAVALTASNDGERGPWSARPAVPPAYARVVGS